MFQKFCLNYCQADLSDDLALSHFNSRFQKQKLTMADTNIRQKKIQLLRQKIITNAHIAHNNAQYRLQQLNDSQDFNKNRLRQSLKQFSSGIEKVVQDYRDCLQELKVQKRESGNNPNSLSKTDARLHILKLKDVQNYLNTQKSVLKEIVEKAESGFQVTQEDKVHATLRKNNLHSILQKIQRKQLESEIKYLSEHIITASGEIYVPDSHMNEAQEKMINEKLKRLIQEVERLTNLEVVCADGSQNTQQQDPCEIALRALKNQSSRLQKVEKILNVQREDLSNFQKWINSFDSFASSVPVPFHINQNSKSWNHTGSPTLNAEQIRLINQSLHLPEGNIVGSRICHHDEIGCELRKMVTKANKIL